VYQFWRVRSHIVPDFKFVTIFQKTTEDAVAEMHLSTSCTAHTVNFLRTLTTDSQSIVKSLAFPGWNKMFYPVSKSFRLAMGPTQSPVQWVQGAFSPGVKRQEGAFDQSPLSSAEVKKWSYTQIPKHIFVVCTKTTLFLFNRHQ
jgi:hypothetical protein